MSNATKPFVLGLLFLVAYFAVGAFLVYSHTPPAPPAGTVAQLSPPFEYFYGSKLAFAVKVPDLQSLFGFGRRASQVAFYHLRE